MAELRKIEMPQHLNDMVEFQLLQQVADPLFEAIDDELQGIHDDILVTTATKKGIERREKILGIMADPEEDLESRRARVLFWWYNRMPYSRKVLEQKVQNLCGNNYTFEYDVENEVLHVGISYSLGWNVINSVYSLLDQLVMLNVVLDVHATAVDDINTRTYVGAAVRTYINNPPIYDNV